jgi:endosialidase-like protein
MKNQNKIFGAILVAVTRFALLPALQAAPQVAPPPDGCYPNFTTAEGCNALGGLTSGAGNTGVGWFALFSAAGSNFNTGIGGGALVLNTGDSNTAVGAAALLLNSTGGDNTAVGTDALVFNTTGVTNVAVGTFAAEHADASFNTAVGGFALRANVDGAKNTAVGAGAMESANGGDDNTAIGNLAGGAYTGTESNNICIGSGTHGTAGESNAIRIGDASSSGGIDVINSGAAANAITIGAGLNSGGINILQTLLGSSITIGDGLSTTNGASSCFVGGIFNQNPTAGSHTVVVGPDNKLADASLSSRRFKRDIAPIDKLSEGILALKPVTFHWKTDTTNEPEFGLVAEDVAEVNLDWITRDPQGKVTGVRYETIPILLLNEFLKEHKKVEDQQASISQLKSEMQTMVAQLKEQAAQIQKVSAQLEINKPAPQVVANKP